MLTILVRLRCWLTWPIENVVECHRRVTEAAIVGAAKDVVAAIESNNQDLRDFRPLLESLSEAFDPCSDGSPSPLLQLMRAEPFMAFKKWLDESQQRDAQLKREYKARESSLLERWQEHSASQQARIEVLEKTLVIMDERLRAIPQNTP